MGVLLMLCAYLKVFRGEEKRIEFRVKSKQSKESLYANDAK